jgi:hypothetical protein
MAFMKKLLLLVAFTLTFSAIAVQADPPVPACPYVCDPGPKGN